MPQSLPLQGLSVLVTRPEKQADALIKQLKSKGAMVLHQPAIAIVADNNALQQTLVQQINDYDWLIFISKNAVEYGLDLIEARQQLKSDLKIAAIGKATCEALTQRGYNTVYCPTEGYDSEALLKSDAFSAEQIHQNKILIIRGGQGREHLKQSLEQRSSIVNYLDAYKREPAKLRLELADLHDIDIITISSQQGLDYLLAMLDAMTVKSMLDKLLIVPSERCHQRAAELGFKRIETAANATDDAMLNCITTKIKA